MEIQRRPIVALVIIVFLSLGLPGCNGVEDKPVDAYQMVWAIDFSPIAKIVENEEDMEAVLNQLQSGMEAKAGKYASSHNVYIKEKGGAYFAFLEVPAIGLDKAKMQAEKPLEFVVMDVEGTGEWTKTNFDESYLVSAEVQFTGSYEPYVSLTFDEEGEKLFEEITKQAIGKRLGILVYGKLITAPIVNEKISDGETRISGDFTIEEARSLSESLMSSVDSPLRLIEINDVRVSF